MRAIPSILFVGGFLGAGKTTAIVALARILSERGIVAGAITNDQAQGLVDTLFMRQDGLQALEVAGSCFCCDFGGLSKALEESIFRNKAEVVLAEPVGSCTDIVATVIRPMRRILGDGVRVHAYSVLVEPDRWNELAEEEGLAPHSMRFLFHKQLQEADFIVITKSDTLEGPALQALVNRVADRYPESTVLSISAVKGEGLDTWLDLVQTTPPGERWLKELDYREYAEAEAEMGWLNAQLSLRFNEATDGGNAAVQIVDDLREGIRGKGGRIGHLKILAVGSGGSVKCGVSGMKARPEVDGSFTGLQDRLDITINMRATLAPEELSRLVERLARTLEERDGVEYSWTYLNTFRPSPPSPTYRYGLES